MYVFGKTIETRKGTFAVGQPLPPEWTGKDTIKQLREQYGDDVLVVPEDAHSSLSAVSRKLTALETAINEIKEALGIGEEKKKLSS